MFANGSTASAIALVGVAATTVLPVAIGLTDGVKGPTNTSATIATVAMPAAIHQALERLVMPGRQMRAGMSIAGTGCSAADLSCEMLERAGTLGDMASIGTAAWPSLPFVMSA